MDHINVSFTEIGLGTWRNCVDAKMLTPADGTGYWVVNHAQTKANAFYDYPTNVEYTDTLKVRWFPK